MSPRAFVDKSGIVLVDKPSGPTSHDVVARVRRAFRRTAVGHAGTLDPAASGLLVVLVGEATKLGPYAGEHDKAYEADVQFGRSTDTLDAEGTTEDEAPIPDELLDELEHLNRHPCRFTRELAPQPLSENPADLPDTSRREGSEQHERRPDEGARSTFDAGGEYDARWVGAPAGRIERALAAELRREWQVPPAFAAIKQGGRPVYELARQGRPVVLPPRAISVRSLSFVRAVNGGLVVRLAVAKGYYVRSFARDLGNALGVPAHLSRLRRLESGPFHIDEAVRLPANDEELTAALRPLAEVVQRVLPVASLTEQGLKFARHGRSLSADHFVSAHPDGHAAWLDPAGRLAAVGRFDAAKGAYLVERGFGQTA